MNTKYITHLVLFLLLVTQNIKTIEISRKKLFAGATAVFTTGIMGTIATVKIILPWIRGINENNKRNEAYKKTAVLKEKHNKIPAIENMSMPSLKCYIQDIKKDKITLETILQTVPFKSDDPLKNSKPIKIAILDLEKKLEKLENHYASQYLKKVITEYSNELHLLKNRQLNQKTIKQYVNESYGAKQYRHYTYIKSLKKKITSYKMLIQHLNQNHIPNDEKTKLSSLKNLLHIATAILTKELQDELVFKQNNQRIQELHEADMKRMRKETEAYQRFKNVCKDLDEAVNAHGIMVREIKQEVSRATQSVRNLTREFTTDRFIKIFEQSGSEARIVNGIKTELNKILQQLTIIKERVKKKTINQENFYPAGTTYCQSYPMPSAPPEEL